MAKRSSNLQDLTIPSEARDEEQTDVNAIVKTEQRRTATVLSNIMREPIIDPSQYSSLKRLLRVTPFHSWVP